MAKDKYFPKGIATGAAFCGRVEERKALKNYIEMHQHVVIAAPSRYGKNSLVAQVLKENDLASAAIDLSFVLSQEDLENQVAIAIGQIFYKLLPKTKVSRTSLLEYIKKLNTNIILTFLEQKIEVRLKERHASIKEMLVLLDQFMVKINKTCAIVFKEFQQVGELKENHTIEALIRHAVERSQRVSYVFCGSKPSLLNEIFSHKSRPFYKLCDLITLERISTKHYTSFLSKAAKRKWGKTLSVEVIEEIITLTENHPYYINTLCRYLWQQTKAPTLKQIYEVWNNYINEHTTWFITEYNSLSLNRKKVITAIAHSPTKEPQGYSFSLRANLPPSTVNRSLADLIKLDAIYRDIEGFYRIVDPAFRYFILKHFDMIT